MIYYTTAYGEKLNQNNMKRILHYTIMNQQDCMTILTFLKTKSYSDQVILHLKRTVNGIIRNGSRARVNELLSYGDALTIQLAEENPSANIVPAPLPLDIIYEDEDIMVINKAAGMPIHPSQGNYTNTLANAAAFYFYNKQTPFVFRCINRLDKETSGLLILAKHMYSASLLSTAIQQREIKRQYLAIVKGKIPAPGTIDAPIGRLKGSTIQRKIDSFDGERAITHYNPMKYKDGHTLVSLQLDTGRTHQIRVHMQFINRPLIGDFLYNPDYCLIQRQALHSYRLNFSHPITNKQLSFTQELPDDMQFILKD